MRSIVVDCTELIQNPVRTGIQRVVRELLRNWPDGGPNLCVARFVAGRGLVGIPERAVEILKDATPETRAASYHDLLAKLENLSDDVVEALPDDGTIFIPEVFYDPARSAFYQELTRVSGRTVAILCYDFLPFLQPGLFNLRTGVPFMEYVRAVRAIPHVGHISEATQRDYTLRIMRGRALEPGPVLPLGADGLKIEQQSWHAERHGFVSIGSLDGRKNQDIIAAAFIELWNDGHAIDLTIVGQAFDGLNRDWITKASCYSHFHWMPDASDESIATLFRRCVATIYMSGAEGYGLPPVESLAAGLPVIAPANMPSLAGLGSLGQILLPEINTAGIASAVLEIEDRETARRLWGEAARLLLGSWRDFTITTVGWLDSL